MISKNDTKRIQRLHQKKFRHKEGLFLAETPKVIHEFLKEGWTPVKWWATDSYLPEVANALVPEQVSEGELKSISRLETANQVLALFEIPAEKKQEDAPFVLALDGVRDPGNMGTILRLADWFGIDRVLCSADCVDVWNPKVVQASMGSVARVQPEYTELADAVQAWKGSGGKVWVADLNGDSHYAVKRSERTMLIMGNEANGPSEELVEAADTVVTIPAFRADGAESLNVSVATAILLGEAMRPS